MRIRKDGCSGGNRLRPSRVGVKNPNKMSTRRLLSEYPSMLGAHYARPDDSYPDAHFTYPPDFPPE
jgi:hypothetical protein